MDIKKLTSSKGFRYGSVAIVFTCVFIAVVLAINVIITMLGQRFSLYVDMTSEEFYTVSESSIEQLSGIETDVEIIFFQKSDKIAESGTLGYVKNLAQEYANKLDFISVKYVDLISQPTAANKYKLSSSDTITQRTVVVHCPETGRSKIIQDRGFYTFSTDQSGASSLYGFNGEKRFTSNILQVTGAEKPLALFTIGHEEYPTGNIMTLLSDEGYEVGTIDLTTQTIPENTDLLIISNPMRDFAGLAAENNGGTNEIKALNSYLSNNHGDILVFLSPVTPELPEFSEYLAEWGISYRKGEVLADTASNTIDTSNLQIIGQYCGDEDSFEYQLHRTASRNGAKTICAYNVPLDIVPDSGKQVVPVLRASSSALSISGETTELSPDTPLVLLSSESRFYNNEEVRANILVFGSPYFFDNIYVTTSTYGNTEILYGAMKMFGNSSVSVDIPTKPFADTTLDITNSAATTATTVLVAIIPLVVLAFGIIVWLRRKAK